jgi:hypothetical protein
MNRCIGHGGKDEVLEDLDVLGVDGGGIDLDAPQLLRPGHDHADRSTADGGLDRGLGQLGLDAGHVGLHLLRHLGQLTDVHG